VSDSAGNCPISEKTGGKVIAHASLPEGGYIWLLLKSLKDISAESVLALQESVFDVFNLWSGLEKRSLHYRLAEAAAHEAMLKRTIASLQNQNIWIKESYSYRLGNLFIRLIKRPSRISRFPSDLWKLIRLRSGGETDTESARVFLQAYRQMGVEGVVRQISVNESIASSAALSDRLLQVGRMMNRLAVDGAELDLAKKALEIDRTDATMMRFFWVAQRSGGLMAACEAIHEIEALVGESPTRAQAEFLQKAKGSPVYLLTALKKLEARKPPQIITIPRRICYVLHNSLPYSSGGYATRSHGVISSLQDCGFEVVALTRPGFPLDIRKELIPTDVPSMDEVDGCTYHRIIAPRRDGQPAFSYVLAAADALEKKFRELRPEVVLAASNHINALPALIASRRLGLPFFYEVRGLWEITRVSREPDFEQKPAFVVQSYLEAAVAKEADYVFTLTEAMREELVRRGVPADQITLLPNSCDPERFLPQTRDHQLGDMLRIPHGVPVIGYVGTFVDYEGLEDLTAACALLKKQEVEFRLLLVGNENASGEGRGPITEQISLIGDLNGFSDWIIMPGRVPHEDVERYYSLIDIAPFPRKPWPVCEMVSPMKPLEALAMEKAVIVSSVRALEEMVQDEMTGLVYEKGNVESLADKLEKLINDASLRSVLGKAGRQWVVEQRTWKRTGAHAYETINSKRTDRAIQAR